MMAMPYTDSELMAILLSREVRDGEVSACGALSHIPAAALLLAQATHAPNAQLIILDSIFYPFRTSKQFHFLAQRGELGLFFVSGVQIDRHGNYNLHQLGADHDHPKMRFPLGMMMMAMSGVVMRLVDHLQGLRGKGRREFGFYPGPNRRLGL